MVDYFFSFWPRRVKCPPLTVSQQIREVIVVELHLWIFGVNLCNFIIITSGVKLFVSPGSELWVAPSLQQSSERRDWESACRRSQDRPPIMEVASKLVDCGFSQWGPLEQATPVVYWCRAQNKSVNFVRNLSGKFAGMGRCQILGESGSGRQLRWWEAPEKALHSSKPKNLSPSGLHP